MTQSRALLRKPGERVKDGFHRDFIPEARIYHQVEAMPFRPVDIEIFLDEVRAVTVHRFRQLDRLLLALADRPQPADLFVERSVDEHVKGVAPASEVISGPSAHDDAIASLRAPQ